jgi:NADPH:quinone reductase-like Zn-dependent oxidoreductase
VPVQEVFAVDCSWTDAELGTIPCAYGTAENMIHRARVSKGDVVLINGASGGVGSAAVQLVKRRGAFIVAITSGAKKNRVQAIGAHRVVTRDEDLLQVVGERSVDVVIDNVAGPDFGCMFKILKPGGRLVTSGAIAGPLVEADLRDIYLKDLTLIGCTAWDEPVFPNLIAYIERGEISPLLVATFPLRQIVEAQQLFSQKNHVGKIVLLPE